MHYVHQDQAVTRQSLANRRRVEDRLEAEIVPRVPADHWRDAGRPLPLRYATDPLTIAWCALPHASGDPRQNAVYILECVQGSGIDRRPVWLNGDCHHTPDGVQASRRVLYVGVTVNLLRRLSQHLRDPGSSGANFTATHPPIRILDVSWWSSYREAERAERLIARKLRERFPNDYVSQPG